MPADNEFSIAKKNSVKDKKQTDLYLKNTFGLSRDNLSGVAKPLGNFQFLELSRVDFSHADLRGANFSGSILNDAKFDHANLKGAIFSEARLIAASLRAAQLGGANFSNALLRQASFDGSILTPEKYIIGHTPQLQRTTFEFSQASDASFKNTNLKGVYFGYAILKNARFQGAIMGRVHWSSPKRDYPTDFSQSDMTSAALSGVDCTGAVVGQAKLDMADLRNCNLERQIFWKLGSLWRTNLSGSNLSYTWCPETFNMVDANLENCNLSGAMLQKAVFSSPSAQLKGATYNDKTKFPQDFSTKGKGLILK